MKFYRSAFKHGINREDAEHVATHPLTVKLIDDDPWKELRFGFDTKARALEVGIIIMDEEIIIIHAMLLRRSYYELLDGLR